MIEAIAHERPRTATLTPDPFFAAQRTIRGQPTAVVVDRRTDRAEVSCHDLASAEALARHMNRDAAEHAAQVWP